MYLGNKPTTDQTYLSLKSQQITGTGTATYSLDYDVAVPEDLAVFVNEIRQNPNTYSVDNQEITLGGTISASDTCYIVYLARSVGTVSPPNNSVGTSKIINGAITNVKIADGAIDNLAIASDASIATTKLGTGGLIQSVYNNTNTQVTASTNTYIATGNKVTITPTSTSSKLLINIHQTLGGSSTNNYSNLRLYEDGSNLITWYFNAIYTANTSSNYTSFSFQYERTPADTNATEYEVYYNVASGGGTIKAQIDNSYSSISVMEIAG